MMRVLWRIFAAPFYHVGFADFWVADQLNSLAVVFTDLHYIVCFYTNIGTSTIDGINCSLPHSVSLFLTFRYKIQLLRLKFLGYFNV